MSIKTGITLRGTIVLAALATGGAHAAEAVGVIKAVLVVPLVVSEGNDDAPAATLSWTPDGGTVTVSTNSSGSDIVLAISGEPNASYVVVVSRPGADEACAIDVSTAGTLSSKGQGSAEIGGLDQGCSGPIEFTIYRE